jgi:DNA ligase 4
MKPSDRYIRIVRDLSINLNEYFLIIFYDILLLDNTIYIRKSYNRRRRLLESLIRCISGRANIGSREIIDFSSFDVSELLNEVFTRAIIRRWEGFVLKNYNKFYFLLKRAKLFIKLKKDYISGFGNIIDFFIIGGRRDARDE